MSTWLLLSQFVAAGALIGLAIWIVSAVPRSRHGWAFAAYLLLRGVRIVYLRVADLYEDSDPQLALALDRTADALLQASPFVLVTFVILYLQRRRAGQWAISLYAVAAAAVVVDLLWPCLVECPDGRLGILHIIGSSMAPVGGAAALLLAAAAARGDRPLATWWVAAGLAIQAILDGGIVLGLVLAKGVDVVLAFEPHWLYATGLVLWFMGMPLGILALRRLPYLDTELEQERRLRITLLAILCGALGTLVGTNFAGWEWPNLFVVGLGGLVLPSFVAYALVRHHLFHVEAGFRVAISSGTIAGIFGAGAFFASEIAENWIGIDGTAPAIGAAALITVGLQPIQLVARRFAEKVLPNPLASDGSREVRAALYQHQARIVFEHGVIDERQRRALDRLRDELRLSDKEAARLEAAAAPRKA